ncbi:hypothetical protein [Burkholderia pyrrocinia]|uniref:Uncharacterized protein n=1 Tax=Burkholderia pyrrocinia TaxID=60550 RepID=A0ABZ3BSU3_BURPY
MKGESNENEKLKRMIRSKLRVLFVLVIAPVNLGATASSSPFDRVGIFTDESNPFRRAGRSRVVDLFEMAEPCRQN